MDKKWCKYCLQLTRMSLHRLCNPHISQLTSDFCSSRSLGLFTKNRLLVWTGWTEKIWGADLALMGTPGYMIEFCKQGPNVSKQVYSRTPSLHCRFFWKHLPALRLFRSVKEWGLLWVRRWRWGKRHHPWLVLSCQVSSWAKHCVTDLKSWSSPWFMLWHAIPAVRSRTGWIIDLFQYNNFYACS